MVHLLCMKLDVTCNLSCICIGWIWRCLWGADQALKILTNYSAVCGWLHCHPDETMLPPTQLWLDGWHVWLNLAMDFADDFVVHDPLTFCYYLEGEFAANIFRFESHSWIFLFQRVRCAWITLNIFVSPSLACLNYLEMISPSLVCLNSSGIVRIFFSCELDRLEFAVLFIFVFRLSSKLPCLFLFFLFSRSFLFLADALPFLFLFCLV